MLFAITDLQRPDVDAVDFSDLTTAVRTGPASWVADGQLDIPFDRDLTQAEVDAITIRLTSASADIETLRNQAKQALANNNGYLAILSPTNAQVVAQVAALTRQMNKVIHLAANIAGTS